VTLRLVVIGDIHTQRDKFWRILREAELCHEDHTPTATLRGGGTRLVLLGDLIHAKSRDRYSDLAQVNRYDEFEPRHVRRAEAAQEAFLREVKAFADELPAEAVTILMGNHDFNAAHPDQSPLRTDDVTHLEWKEGHGGEMEDELRTWILGWPHEHVVEGLHFAHVGPLPEHNTYDNAFYLENRRRWIFDERDYLEDTPYRLGVYGHTPVRGGVNIASQGRAILLDTNGYQDEYCWLAIELSEERYRLRMHGLFFDEWVQR
jgi:hypothetical protein